MFSSLPNDVVLNIIVPQLDVCDIELIKQVITGEDITLPACIIMSKNGYYNLLKWTHISYGIRYNSRIIKQYSELENIIDNAGNVECLDYLLKIKLTPTKLCAYNAARNGRTDCLKLLFDNIYSMYDHEVVRYAAINGHIETVKYLATIFGHTKGYAAIYAAVGGQLDCLIELERNNWHFSPLVTSEVIKHNHVHCLKWLIDKNVFINANCIHVAVKHKSFDCLQYLVEYGVPVPYDIQSFAADSTRKIVEYLHKRNYEINRWCVLKAIENNNLEIVQYMFENQCPTFFREMRMGKLRLIDANNNTMFLDEMRIISYGMLAWMDKNNYPPLKL